MRSHHLLAILGTLLAGVLVAATGGPVVAGAARATAPAIAAPADLPGGTTTVTVSEGNINAGIDADLTPAASIAGSLTSSTGRSLSGEVDAYVNGKLVATGYAINGHYQIVGLSAGSYAVCASATTIGGGSGFLGRCWKKAAFYGTVPSGAALVTVADSEQRTGVDLVLPPAAAIGGTVTTPGGVGLDNLGVVVRNRSTGRYGQGLTRSGGVYVVFGLGPSAKGYAVCFKPQIPPTGTGYLPRCYHDKAWSGGRIPDSATPVSVTLGKIHRRIDQTLPPGGAVAGKVTSAATGDGVRGALVSVYSAKGRVLGSAFTRATGRYRITALPAATGDHVCVKPLNRAPKPSFHGLCWKHAAWNGGTLPSRAAPVKVRASATHTGVDLHLRPWAVDATASISGTVTQQSDGTPVEGAFVYLFHNGTKITDKPTNAAGQYTFSNLGAGSGWTICVQAFRVSSPIPPDTGFAARCYGDVPWNGLDLPDAATTFALTSGQSLTGIDVALHPAGEIDGTTFALDGITPVSGAIVDIYTTAGDLVTFDYTSGDGSYRVKELIPGDYVVCFDGRFTGEATYAPECYDDVAWSGQ